MSISLLCNFWYLRVVAPLEAVLLDPRSQSAVSIPGVLKEPHILSKKNYILLKEPNRQSKISVLRQKRIMFCQKISVLHQK